MELIFSEAFGIGFFTIGTVIVTLMVWAGYYRDRFSPWLAWLSTLVFITYMVSFLAHRYVTGHMSEHALREPSYIVLAAVHGTIALCAVVLTCIVFVRAERAYGRGENFFRLNPRISLCAALLWPLALFTGLLL